MHFSNNALATLTLIAFGFIALNNTHAQTANNEQHVTVTVRPAQTIEERVADEFKEKELRRVTEEKVAATRSAEIAANTPKAVLSRAQTIHISSGTSFFEPIQLQNALRKRTEFDSWQLAVVDGWDKGNIADISIEVDRPLFTYTFTYQVTARSTGIVLASGKITAFDGDAAAPILAGKIVDELRKARGESKVKK